MQFSGGTSHAESSAILQGEGFLLYLYGPLTVTLMRVYISFEMTFLKFSVALYCHSQLFKPSGECIKQAVVVASLILSKESGWKLCVNWPIGGWKKYSLYTLYYLSIVISQDLDGIFPCSFWITLLCELFITYFKWVIIGAFRMLKNLTFANACTFIPAVFCYIRTMFDICLEQAKPSTLYRTKRNEIPPHICHISECYIGNAHSVIVHMTHSFYPRWNIWEVRHNIY